MQKTNIIYNLLSLLVPPVCTGCEKKLSEGELGLCTNCRINLPFTYDWKRSDNEAYHRLDGLFKVEWAASFGYYRHDEHYANAIRNIKFRQSRETARHLGEWFAYEATTVESPLKDIDILVPMPIHITRKLWRGYNQSDEIALGMAKILRKPIERHAIKRMKIGKVQSTLTSKNARLENSTNMFKVTDAEKIADKHILLIDDVLTSGATMLSLIDCIKRASPECKISVATLSRSEKNNNRYTFQG